MNHKELIILSLYQYIFIGCYLPARKQVYHEVSRDWPV